MPWIPAAITAGGSILGGFLGGRDKKVVNESKAPSWALPHLQSGLTEAQNLYGASPAISPEGWEAMDLQSQLARQMMPMGQQITGFGQDLMSGNWLSAEANPYLQGAISAAINPVQERLMEQILPSLKTSATFSGAEGGSAEALLQGQALQDFSREAGNLAAGISLQNYQGERDKMMLAPQLMQAGAQTSALAPTLLQGVNQQKVNAPWDKLRNYTGVTQGLAGFGGSQTQTQQGDPVAGAIGGGMLGYNLYNGWNQANQGQQQKTWNQNAWSGPQPGNWAGGY